MADAPTTITIRQTLAEIDEYYRDGQLYIFSLSYLVTTGKNFGKIHTKNKVSKKKELPVYHRVNFNLFDATPINIRTPNTKKGGFKGHNKRDRTLPLFDQEKQQYFKIKLSALLSFNGMRIIRPIYSIKQKPVYPSIKNGECKFNTKIEKHFSL